MELQPVVFLDRDGTLNVERGHIECLERFELIDGVAESIRRLNQHRVFVIVVTNQSGIARGLYSTDHVQTVNDKMIRQLGTQLAYVDAVYFCPHLPDGIIAEYSKVCACRKPAPGLVEQAFEANALLDRTRSFVVGDTDRDLGLARACNAKAILVETGKTKASDFNNSSLYPDFVAPTLSSAVDWIIDDLKQGDIAMEDRFVDGMS